VENIRCVFSIFYCLKPPGTVRRAALTLGERVHDQRVKIGSAHYAKSLSLVKYLQVMIAA
jgi:hypothetical protein